MTVFMYMFALFCNVNSVTDVVNQKDITHILLGSKNIGSIKFIYNLYKTDIKYISFQGKDYK